MNRHFRNNLKIGKIGYISESIPPPTPPLQCRHTHIRTHFVFSTEATVPHYGHIISRVVQRYVKKPQSLAAHQDSTALVAHFSARRVVPGDVVRDSCEVEDVWRHQGAFQHSHVPGNRENPLKLDFVVFTVLCNTHTYTSVENGVSIYSASKQTLDFSCKK